MADTERRVVLGTIAGVYGVKGWIRVHSATEPRERILDYGPWQIGRRGSWREQALEAGRRHGGGVIAKLAGVDDRDAAAALVGAEIAVPRSRLPAGGADEYYWVDLVGLEVVTAQGVALGHVDRLLATGANDVLVVKNGRERLIPFLRGSVIRSVDLEAGVIEVDWDPDF
ncbi:MAG TPA: ribosome maturation factor RimM [Gammaproteobacteria bacterium]|nr:ribosome maturation factor RimM [Gammaproteobacteria bacterium]